MRPTIIRAVSVLAVLFAPVLASAQGGYTGMYTQTSQTFFSGGTVFGPMAGTCVAGSIICVAQTILYIINGVLVPVVFAVAFLVFLYGVARTYIFSNGEPDKISEGHKLILWGIIGFVVMLSLWGLVNVVANTFGLTGSYAPPLPYTRSY